MKRICTTLVLFIAMSIAVIAEEPASATIALLTLQCGMCKNTIESKVTGTDGILSIVVSVAEKTATVTYDSDVISLEDIEFAITKTGYDANEKKADRRAQKKLHACCQPGAHD